LRQQVDYAHCSNRAYAPLKERIERLPAFRAPRRACKLRGGVGAAADRESVAEISVAGGIQLEINCWKPDQFCAFRKNKCSAV
jgi:hypothetical protein